MFFPSSVLRRDDQVAEPVQYQDQFIAIMQVCALNTRARARAHTHTHTHTHTHAHTHSFLVVCWFGREDCHWPMGDLHITSTPVEK